MSDNHEREANGKAGEPVTAAKVVAEMPQDDDMRSELEDMKAHDGYPGSCGIGNPPSSKETSGNA
ncbi:hypothetical protein [Paenibacillus humicola]|uniref:hypothetical protein n=1 Tax=Paenibacillus humicola TaxID=3110540 RepID=UPI00237A5E79|nr:hypothetical protein [Paenibacillus humicola]